LKLTDRQRGGWGEHITGVEIILVLRSKQIAYCPSNTNALHFGL